MYIFVPCAFTLVFGLTPGCIFPGKKTRVRLRHTFASAQPKHEEMLSTRQGSCQRNVEELSISALKRKIMYQL